MSQEKPTTYTAEFKASSVKLAHESDQSIAQTAKASGLYEKIIDDSKFHGEK